MEKTMKAAVWTGIDCIEVKDVLIPQIGEEEALLKVRSAGVCVTDYHIISGKLKIGKCPNIQGHEICGEVVEINSTRKDIKLGMRCVVATSVGCGHCEFCREGKEYLCEQSGEIGYYPYNGGYAEYVKVPISCVVPIPDSISDATAAILESTVCPSESLMRIGVPFAGTVLVAGVGPAGLAFISVAKLLGAGKIISLVRSEASAKKAVEYGATDVINTSLEDGLEAINRITNGERADIAIEATGATNIMEELPYYLKKGGKIILYGIPGDEDKVNLPIKKIVVEEMTVYGAVGNTKAWYPLVKMLDQKNLDFEKMVTHRFKLEDIDKAFDLYRNHDRSLIKAIIEF